MNAGFAQSGSSSQLLGFSAPHYVTVPTGDSSSALSASGQFHLGSEGYAIRMGVSVGLHAREQSSTAKVLPFRSRTVLDELGRPHSDSEHELFVDRAAREVALEEILRRMSEEYSDGRFLDAIAQVLGRVAGVEEDPRVAAALRKLATHLSAAVRYSAVVSLARTPRSQETINVLGEAAERDENSAVRVAARESLEDLNC